MSTRLGILLSLLLSLSPCQGAEADASMEKFHYNMTKILVEIEMRQEKRFDEGSPEYASELDQRIRQRMAKDKKEKEEREERLRQLPRTDPAAYAKIARFLDNQNFMQSPIHLTDKWFLFVQPDHTLTIIELATGKVLLQDSSRHSLNILEWKQVGNRTFAFAEFGGGMEIIDNGFHAPTVQKVSPSVTGNFENASTRSGIGWHFMYFLQEQSNLKKARHDKTGEYPWEMDYLAELPGDGVAWVSKSKTREPPAYELHFNDEETSWSGTINTVSDLLLFEQYKEY